jgi:5-methylcytosine-specific restriction endonuclease McrA
MTNSRISRLIREQVIQRAKGCCEYCFAQQKFSMDTFSIEHVFPKSRGGSDDFNNLALSCQGCNACKSNRTEVIDPETKQTVPFYNPRTDIWADHFVWSEDYINLIGLTPTGRGTIAALQLNRPGNQNLRHVLHLFGEHPP